MYLSKIDYTAEDLSGSVSWDMKRTSSQSTEYSQANVDNFLTKEITGSVINSNISSGSSLAINLSELGKSYNFIGNNRNRNTIINLGLYIKWVKQPTSGSNTEYYTMDMSFSPIKIKYIW
jgi:hypothetical protein